ncbi:MAG: hypothetical protein JO316_09845 [Abitibacteriaceae bacterium]|nr:hypothetical protein [Abditibacteriaceae bacterium]
MKPLLVGMTGLAILVALRGPLWHNADNVIVDLVRLAMVLSLAGAINHCWHQETAARPAKRHQHEPAGQPQTGAVRLQSIIVWCVVVLTVVVFSYTLLSDMLPITLANH